MTNKPANIIVEGFWKVGKSTIIKKIAANFGYEIINEPNHLNNQVDGNISDWYVSQHLKSLEKYISQKSVIIERSLLSSVAYLYAKQESMEKITELMAIFNDYYSKNKPLVVFIYGDKQLLLAQAEGVKDIETKALLSDPEFLERYESFYRLILPLQFNVVVLMVKVDDVNEEAHNKAADNILSAIDHNRIGQVNIACYRLNEKAPEFLLLKRNPQKGSFWQVVTGGIKVNQSLIEAAAIELGEELSLNVSLKNLSQSDYSFYYVGAEGYELNEYVFGYQLSPNDIITLSDEHVESRFVSFDQALELLKYDSNKEALKSIQRQFSSLI